MATKLENKNNSELPDNKPFFTSFPDLCYRGPILSRWGSGDRLQLQLPRGPTSTSIKR